MENASKALIIAGEVLLGVLLLALIVFVFGRLGNVELARQESEEQAQVVEYNKEFESYNRKDLLGNDIISIINKVEDYNKREAKNKSYKAIELNVNLVIGITGTNDFTAGNYNFDLIRTKYNNVNNKIQNLLKEKYNGKDISYYASQTSDVLESVCQNLKNSQNQTVSYDTIKKKVDEYNLYSSVLKEFKKKKFRCSNVDYDKTTGRISLMKFEEQ